MRWTQCYYYSILSRILAELKTRAFMVLSLEVRDPAFADEFLNFNNDITETMSSIAHLCTSGTHQFCSSSFQTKHSGRLKPKIVYLRS